MALKTESIRQLKFAREMQREVANILQREVDGLENQLLNITLVKVTPDLQNVRIYLTVIPEKDGRLIVNLLNEEQAKIRNALARRIRNRVRVIPSLKFFYDDTVENARRIESIFDKLAAEQATRPAAEGDALAPSEDAPIA
jgi:ribosome-binding factor A